MDVVALALLVVVGLLLAPAVFMMFLLPRIQAQHQAELLCDAARRLGLTDVHETRSREKLSEVRGESNGFTVILQPFLSGHNNLSTRLMVRDGRGRIPASLELRAESLSSGVEKTFGATEVESGDPAFDDEVYARGPEDLLVRLLDERTRSLVRQVIGWHGRIVGGELRVELPGWTEASALARTAETLLAAGRSLAGPVDVAERLVAGLRGDPLLGVRLRCLDLLARGFSGDERARAALREALGAADAELRLRAAMALAEEGRDTLIEIAASPDAEETRAARALAALGASAPVERVGAILEQAAQSGRRALALAAVAALAEGRSALSVPRLAPFLTRADDELAVAAARALAAIGDASAEPALIGALSSESRELRLAAVTGLGPLGSAVAVAALRTTLDAHRLDLALRSAARQAIASIQSRAPGASPGQVSLSEGGEAGQVSLPGENHAGRVSVTEE